jgi:hypothetical protein
VSLRWDYQRNALGQQYSRLKVPAWWCVVRGTGWVISMVNPRPFLDLLAVSAELTAARSVLRELIMLADEAPGLTEEQLRCRLLALAGCAAPRSPAVSRSPAGRWLSEAPDSAPDGQPAPHDIVRSAP